MVSQNGSTDSKERYFRLVDGINSLDDPPARVEASCCGVNLAFPVLGFGVLVVQA